MKETNRLNAIKAEQDKKQDAEAGELRTYLIIYNDFIIYTFIFQIQDIKLLKFFTFLIKRNGEATDRGRTGGRYECQTYRKRQIQESSGFKI